MPSGKSRSATAIVLVTGVIVGAVPDGLAAGAAGRASVGTPVGTVGGAAVVGAG